MKQTVLAAALVAAGVAVAGYFAWANRSYYPVAKVTIPEGVTFTAFSNEAQGRSACAEANERFVGPLRDTCPSCVVSMHCENKDDALKLVLDARQNHYVAESPGIRVAVAGPEKHAKAGCDLIAAEMLAQGTKSGRCVAPQK